MVKGQRFSWRKNWPNVTYCTTEGSSLLFLVTVWSRLNSEDIKLERHLTTRRSKIQLSQNHVTIWMEKRTQTPFHDVSNASPFRKKCLLFQHHMKICLNFKNRFLTQPAGKPGNEFQFIFHAPQRCRKRTHWSLKTQVETRFLHLFLTSH